MKIGCIPISSSLEKMCCHPGSVNRLTPERARSSKRLYRCEQSALGHTTDSSRDFGARMSSPIPSNTTPQATRAKSKLESSKADVKEMNNMQLSDFKVLRVIGRGNFGIVQLVQSQVDGRVYVLKKVRVDLIHAS